MVPSTDNFIQVLCENHMGRNLILCKKTAKPFTRKVGYLIVASGAFGCNGTLYIEIQSRKFNSVTFSDSLVFTTVVLKVVLTSRGLWEVSGGRHREHGE